ncbi:uncharacterized protein LOC132192960 [Neocloeon triangulifer]|uniref:uncharacterized protein LOC132192960 n=1 Tax=Neocloeon triangulifer TaxID=2078957 RepID=UPI00286EDCB8|nr:uncharacterized protein LOC132192960 [Neocloeon triangulifer]
MSNLEKNLEKWKDQPWMIDVNSGTSVTFGDAYEKSKNVANVLARLGFKQGDVLYYVTFEMAQVYVVHLAAWLLGGAVRGCFQGEAPEVYARQISESKSTIVVVDSDTAPVVKKAIDTLDYEVHLLFVGANFVEGAMGYEMMSADRDNSAMPEFLEIDPREEVVAIPSTSGSTGVPKGVLHTHFSAVAQLTMFSKIDYMKEESHTMALMTNYAIGNFFLTMNALYLGATVYNIGKFSFESYFDLILQYKAQDDKIL